MNNTQEALQKVALADYMIDSAVTPHDFMLIRDLLLTALEYIRPLVDTKSYTMTALMVRRSKENRKEMMKVTKLVENLCNSQ